MEVGFIGMALDGQGYTFEGESEGQSLLYLSYFLSATSMIWTVLFFHILMSRSTTSLKVKANCATDSLMKTYKLEIKIKSFLFIR